MDPLATMYALKAQNVTMPQGAESVCRDVRSLGGFGAQAWLAYAVYSLCGSLNLR